MSVQQWLVPCAKGVAKIFRNSGRHAHEVDDANAAAPLPFKAGKKAAASVYSHSTIDTLPNVFSPDDSDSDSDTETVSASSHTSARVSIVHAEDLQAEIDSKIKDVMEVNLDPEDLIFEETLQSAPRNQGRVDLMRSLARGGKFAAVKRMPTSWITSGPEAFEWKHPGATEKPWFDIGVVKYLHDEGFDHVCEPWGLYKDATHTYVVNSLATEGELFSWMNCDPSPGPEREVMARPIMKQMFSAVRWLHDLGIAHRDLSLENILLTQSEDGLQVKLIDFGMATLKRSCLDICGKKSYIAPEMYVGTATDPFLTDAFALGVVLFSVCCREYPWNTTTPGGCKLFEYVHTHGLRTFLRKRKAWRSKVQGQRLAEVVSEPLVAILEGLLQMHPKQRFTLGERCWVQQSGVSRQSVWDFDWLQAQD